MAMEALGNSAHQASRNIRLDVLRVIGVLVIVIAHADPPAFLAQLRNFGTPLLIVVSGLTFAYIYAERTLHARDFFKRRLARLLFPVWLFLSVFFGIFLLADVLLGKEFPFARDEVLLTFALYGGIGYVWIFKVYVYLALMTPFALRFSASAISNSRYLALLAIALSLNWLLVAWVHGSSDARSTEVLDALLFVIVPYAVLYLYGMRLSSLKTSTILLISAVALVVFYAMAAARMDEVGVFVPTQADKYPPGPYYLSYALAAVNLVYLGARAVPPMSRFLRSAIIWLSANAMWIYLWHILGIYIWAYALGPRPQSYAGTAAMTLWIVLFGVLATAAHRSFSRAFLASSKHALLRHIASVLR